MEPQDIILIIVTGISSITAVVALIIGILQSRKNKEIQREINELEKERFEWEKKNKELERRLEKEKFEWEKANKELWHSIKESEDAVKLIEKTIPQTKKEKHKMHYYCKIEEKFALIDLGGLKNPGIKYLQMGKVYVKQQVEYIPPRDPQTQKDERYKKKSSKKIEDFQTAFENLSKEYSKQNKALKLIIRGPAGSGKTTLLKWIALQCIPAGENFLPGFIPIVISLKDLALDPDNSFRSNNLRQLSIIYLTAINVDPSLFDDAFEDDKVIFLFDGLDEVTDKNIRLEVMEWILSQNTGRNPLLITTRESGLQDTRGLNILPPIQVCRLLEFEIREILRFLDNWCENIEKDAEIVEGKKKNSLEDTQKIILKSERKCSQLKETIGTNQRLFQLAKNPLLLTIIAILQINKDQLKWPMEQHELYEECLKLMIELKDHGNSRSDTGLVVDIYMEYLSYIALFLVENNCSEIEQSQIKTFLPMPVEENQLKSFLNDMSQKIGLLYESRGKYGFSNVTFQEYLVARYLAREKKPTDILEFQEKYSCSEITKLYVNTIDKENTTHFFNIIIENLVRKDYWKQIRLWEDCLLNAVDKSTQENIEIRFAKKVLEILRETEYKENGNNVELIISLYAHYPLFKHARQFMNEALDLFERAKHPIAQSVGSSILNDGDEKNQARLMKGLKNRIDNFETKNDKTLRQSFLYQNSNSFPLLIYGRKNVLDFFYVLAKLRSKNLFLNFLILLHLESLWYILDSTKLLNLPKLKELLEFLDIRELLEKPKIPVDLDPVALRDLLTLQGFIEFRNKLNIRDFLESQYYNKFQGLIDEFENKYKSRLVELKEEINTWTDKASARLHPLPDEKLLKYFPGTTKEDIKIFRDGKKGTIEKHYQDFRESNKSPHFRFLL